MNKVIIKSNNYRIIEKDFKFILQRRIFFIWDNVYEKPYTTLMNRKGVRLNIINDFKKHYE